MDDKNIPQNLQNIIFALFDKFPEIYFGGSVALNILGLLNRHVNDIDICVPKEKSGDVIKYMNKKKFGKLKSLWKKPEGDHIKFNFKNYSFCIFLTENSYKYRYNLNGKYIYLSNVDDIISAKRIYMNRCINSGGIIDEDGHSKHKNDLNKIDKKIKHWERRKKIYIIEKRMDIIKI